MKNKNKIIILVSSVLAILLIVIGVTYAAYTYTRSGATQELVLGDIWMKYTETNGISLQSAMPGDAYDSSNPDNYFEFTITGTNTYEKKDIWYEIVLTKGDVPDGKDETNRIPDEYLKFRLVEVTGETETEIFTDKTYDDLTNKRVWVETIPTNTTTYSKTYRLYMVISENLKIGNTEDSVILMEDYENAFATIKVNVTGDFEEKYLTSFSKEFKEYVTTTRTDAYIEEDGIVYISGSYDKYDNKTNKKEVDFNYVWYSGKLWRITAINPDGTMKMITERLMTSIDYGENERFYTDEENKSDVYQWLNQEFLPTLYNYENIIVTDAKWNITPSNTADEKLPTTEAEGATLVESPVGLLNSYEFYKSAENYTTSFSYTSYYLNIYCYWFLLNSKENVEWLVRWSGGIIPSYNTDYYNSFGVRPVINLKANVQLLGGTGSIDDPYRIKGDKEDVTVNTTLLNTRQSGEYVKLENDSDTSRVFRIVGTENVSDNLTTKLILDDFVRSGENEIAKNFSSGEVLWSNIDNTDETYMKGYLNNTWLATLDNNLLDQGTYYLGVNDSNQNYKTTVCSTVDNNKSTSICINNGDIVPNTWTGYVGLPRYGEMFASGFAGESFSSSYRPYSAPNKIWLITPGSDSEVMFSNAGWNAPDNLASVTYKARPTINLKSGVVIKSGTGLENDPFVVGLPTE